MATALVAQPNDLKASSISIDPLKTGGVLEQGIWKKGEASPEPTKGQAIANQVEDVYRKVEVVNNLLGHAVSNPMRPICSVAALLYGLSAMYSGSVCTGGLAVLAGFKEILNMTGNSGASNLQTLLREIHAGTQGIETLHEANIQSCQDIQRNLSGIHSEISNLYGQMAELSKISIQEQAAVQERKQEVEALNKDTVKAYQDALKLFESAQKSLEQSSGFYSECAQYFKTITEIVNNDDPTVPIEDKIKRLLETSREASEKCSAGKELLDATSCDMSRALEALKHADDLKCQVMQAYGEVSQFAKCAEQKTKEMAKVITHCDKKVAQSQEEMEKVLRRSEGIMNLIQALKAKAVKAMNLAACLPTWGQALTGIVAAGCAPVSWVYAVPLGLATLGASRHRSTIVLGAARVYNFARGITPPKPEPMDSKQLTHFAFNERSSGTWGFTRGLLIDKSRPSATVGILRVNFGDEVFSCEVNFGNDERMSMVDILSLYEIMTAKVRDGKMDPQRCLDILKKLEEQQINRGPLHSSVTGFISKTDASYAVIRELQDLCQQKLKLAENIDLRNSLDLSALKNAVKETPQPTQTIIDLDSFPTLKPKPAAMDLRRSQNFGKGKDNPLIGKARA